MKSILLYTVLLVNSICFGQAEERNLIDQLHRKKFDWLINKNYDSLSWILEDQVKYIHSNGWVQTKQNVLEDLKSGKLIYTNVSVTEASTVFYGSQTAVVTGKGLFTGLMPDKSEFKINLLYTEVYVKIKKHWKLVSRQATRIN